MREQVRTASILGCSGWKTGDLRLVCRRVLIPRCVNGCWYWLSKLYVVQRYRAFTPMCPNTRGFSSYRWINCGWSCERPEGDFYTLWLTANESKFVLNGDRAAD